MDDLDHENFLLAEKLRQEDPDQFYILVRMHLSFVLDLNADDCDSNSEKKCKAIKWSLPFTKKQKMCSKNSVEGTLLTLEFITQIHPIIEFLSKEENISQEGIFRRSGRVTRQQELKVLLHQGAELNFNDGQFSVHECATVLKSILSELPESVLTDGHYPAYCQIAELCGGANPANKEKLLRSIQLLILLLPFENRKFFQEIIELLHLAVSHEDKNRMSADNLATLFTPHLLCPRRLSPEAFHTNSQIMSRVVAFMIEKGSELFKIPPTVATDVRAYWDKKERRKLSPLKQMNESVCDGTAANTVFTFVDRERTAQESRTNPTETALAQLYAYIQSLPESSKKRKLVKQFNKENGYGTPLRVGGKKRAKALNLGDSIKKHLSGFGKTTKRNMNQEAVEDEEVASPEPAPSHKKAHSNEEKLRKENLLPPKHPVLSKNSSIYDKKPAGTLFASFEEDIISSSRGSLQCSNKSCEGLDDCVKAFKKDVMARDLNEPNARNQTSQGVIVKIGKKRSSSSPVKISPCKSPRVSDEHLKPNLVPTIARTHQEHQKWPVSNQNQQNLFKSNLSKSFFGSAQNLNNAVFRGKEPFLSGSCKTPRRAMSDFHLCEGFAEEAVENPIRTPLQKFNTPIFVRNTNNNGLFSSPNNTNRLPILYGPKNSFLMTTSTPAPGNGCLVTPVVDKNNSMSPITKSARRMPKAMQETMMTPRSRKPVISLSSTDLCNLANGDSLGDDDEDDSQSSKGKVPNGKRLILEDSNEGTGNDSLSSTFRNYLFSRSILTASPVDLSFSSRTDDFLSLSDKSSSGENENFKSLPEILNEAGLSESLLYCLDGNDPESDSGGNESEGKVADCSCSFSDSDENLHRVYETAL